MLRLLELREKLIKLHAENDRSKALASLLEGKYEPQGLDERETDIYVFDEYGPEQGTGEYDDWRKSSEAAIASAVCEECFNLNFVQHSQHLLQKDKEGLLAVCQVSIMTEQLVLGMYLSSEEQLNIMGNLYKSVNSDNHNLKHIFSLLLISLWHR